MTPDAATLPRDAVDCDVHCAPASMDVLLPYLDDYWRSYIDDATIRLGDLAYPAGAATTGGPAPAAYEDLAPLLDREATRAAVLSCVVLDGVHRNPHYAAAVATAINDWLRDAWLARDPRLRAGIVVSTLDIPAAVQEIERLADDPRFVQVLLPVRSDVPYGNRLYHPLYARGRAQRPAGRAARVGAGGRRAEHDRHRADVPRGLPLERPHRRGPAAEPRRGGRVRVVPGARGRVRRVRLHLAAVAAVAVRQGLEGRLARWPARSSTSRRASTRRPRPA